MAAMHIAWLWIFLDVPHSFADSTWAFWSAATHNRIAERGGRHNEVATLRPQAGDAWVKLQSVGGAGGIHLDVDTRDPACAGERAETLGASRRWDSPNGHVVMQSPGGLTFCCTAARPGQLQQHRDAEVLLDQICLDVPPGILDRETRFWSEFLQLDLLPGALPGFIGLVRPPGLPVRLLFREVPGAGAVTAHIDLACRNRAAELSRHHSLGAVVVDDQLHWTVLRDPAGMTYWLTDRVLASGLLA